VAFGADEPNSSEPAKGLTEGVCQMLGGGYGCGDERGMGGEGQRDVFDLFDFDFIVFCL